MGQKYSRIHKETINKQILTADLESYLADGWLPGWFISQEALANWKRKFRETYNNKTEEEKEALKLKNSIGNKKRWAETTPERKQEIAKAVSAGISEMWTNLSDEDRALREEHRLQTRETWTATEYLEYTTKMSEAAKQERATRTDEQYAKAAAKGFATKAERHNLNTSMHEEKVFDVLITNFTEVRRNYSADPRYPWHCDFYIPSLDLFIEINDFPTHYTEPFDETNPEHLKLLEQYKTNPQNWIEEQRVSIWAGSDVLKYSTAKKNNLNYIMIYNNIIYGDTSIIWQLKDLLI